MHTTPYKPNNERASSFSTKCRIARAGEMQSTPLQVATRELACHANRTAAPHTQRRRNFIEASSTSNRPWPLRQPSSHDQMQRAGERIWRRSHDARRVLACHTAGASAQQAASKRNSLGPITICHTEPGRPCISHSATVSSGQRPGFSPIDIGECPHGCAPGSPKQTPRHRVF